MLSSWDIAIVIAYFILLLYIGFRTGKDENEEDFLIGGRKIKGFQTIASVGSSLVGAGMLLSAVALSYSVGAGAIWLFLGYALGFYVLYLLAKWLRPLSAEHHFYTLPDFFYFRFGSVVGKFSAVFIVLISLGWITVNFIGGGQTIEVLTPLNFNVSTIIVGLIIIIYVLLGGFRAVVQTDVIQFIGLLILFGILGYLIFKYSINLSSNDLNIFNLPIGQLVSFFLVGIIVPLSSGELWQRIYAVDSVETFRKSTIWLSVFLVLLGVVLVLIGLILRQQLPQANPSNAIVEGFKELLPSGWRGLAVVVFYSTIMSSADSYLFSASTSISRDILYRGQKTNSNSRLRIWILVLGIAAIVFAINLRDVLDMSFVLVSLMFALGFIILYIWLAKSRAKTRAVLFCFICSSISIIATIYFQGISEMLVGSALIGVLIGLLISQAFRLIQTTKP